MSDPFNLSRFVDAQDKRYPSVLAELGRGRKTSHWMWYVFPQIAGLGFSHMSRKYAISSPGEAKAYLEHPVLGPRLVECTQILLAQDGVSARQVFGAIDTMKFRSCMTLFAEVAADNDLFRRALDKFFDGAADEKTLALLQASDQ